MSLNGRWARASLATLLSTVFVVGALAQTNEEGSQPPRDQNSKLRNCTWSIYAQGGLSWSTDVWYQNVNAKRSYKLSPAVGGGVDFTIRPWVRVGADYLWSRYRREQRLSALDTKDQAAKAYGNYIMNFHNVKLGVGFNLMELWNNRKAQWFNVWLGTGTGYTFAYGTEYGIYFSSVKTQDGKTTPLTEDGANISNGSALTITGNVRTTNTHKDFNTFYVPLTLHVEADVTRQITVGLKGEMDWLFDRKEIAPQSFVFALATVRYNFVPSRASLLQNYYEGEISKLRDGEIAALNETVNNMQREAAEAQAQADKARLEADQLNAKLQNRLTDCENREVTLSHFVQFDHNSSYMSKVEIERLRAFAQTVKGQKLILVAEASTPGSSSYNQELSERRLARVADFLVSEGFDRANLNPTTAIGEQKNKSGAEGRRVTITIEHNN